MIKKLSHEHYNECNKSIKTKTKKKAKENEMKMNHETERMYI